MDVKCTVVMPLYNKEKYIEQAINSVLNQVTNYKYQLIIADDCSTDSSLSIAENYEYMYEDKIKVLRSEQNRGLLANDIRVFEDMKTEYFCVLDPDDYWIDKEFLQKAIGFLEENPDFVCYSGNTIVDDGVNKRAYIQREELEIVTNSIEDYFNGSAVVPHTTSAVYRNVIFKNGVPEIIRNAVGTSSEASYRGDHDRFVIHIKYGKSMFVNDFVGYYRQDGNGIWSGAKAIHNALLEAQAKFDYSEFYDGVYENQFRRKAQIYYPWILKEKREGELRGEILSEQDKILFTNVRKQMEILQRELDAERIAKQNERLLTEQNGIQKEILWANIFHDTIRGSKWFGSDISLSPGRWALGYPALYALYRILDETQPVSILELGLGQSTKMIASYVKYAKENNLSCEHYVLEHDESWIRNFSKSFNTDDIDIVQLDMQEIMFEDSQLGQVKVNVYEGFKEFVGDKKFDFIFIDAPIGSDEYSRIDLINVLPYCLKGSFVIFMDDSNRIGEQRSLSLMESILSQNQIGYWMGRYQGEKDSMLLVSEDLKFLCTM